MQASESRAADFYEYCLLRSVFKLLAKNVQFMQNQRDIEMEHEYRKMQIDNFFANMKNKAAEDQEKEQLKEKLKSPIKVKMPEKCESPKNLL